MKKLGKKLYLENETVEAYVDCCGCSCSCNCDCNPLFTVWCMSDIYSDPSSGMSSGNHQILDGFVYGGVY